MLSLCGFHSIRMLWSFSANSGFSQIHPSVLVSLIIWRKTLCIRNTFHCLKFLLRPRSMFPFLQSSPRPSPLPECLVLIFSITSSGKEAKYLRPSHACTITRWALSQESIPRTRFPAMQPKCSSTKRCLSKADCAQKTGEASAPHPKATYCPALQRWMAPLPKKAWAPPWLHAGKSSWALFFLQVDGVGQST